MVHSVRTKMTINGLLKLARYYTMKGVHVALPSVKPKGSNWNLIFEDERTFYIQIRNLFIYCNAFC